MRPASTVPADYPIPNDVLEVTGLEPTPVCLTQIGGWVVRLELDSRGGVGCESGQRWGCLKRDPLPKSE